MVAENEHELSSSVLVEKCANSEKKHIWNDAYARFDQQTTSYEEEYVRLTEEMLKLGDIKHDTDSKRAEDIEKLEQDHQHWVNAARKAQEAVDDTSSLKEQQKEIESLEYIKKQLLDAFVRESDQNKELREKIKELDRPMHRLEQFNSHVYQKEHFEVPTKEFTLKVLKLLSAAYIKEDGDLKVFKGFFTKPQTNDVIPFNFKEDVSEHERVEHVWSILSQFMEFESAKNSH
ncbi:unnamed protein product [Agarophyton chilense]|eukprot:gb/GEZJ01000935.1/.p1 GENE.gb/GEZJ01000935.1/~~gb/GEZJ01000935.1/.p1  ORF type:complete len:232 (+),score=45.95 gb/GEZJ01000935.1/:430-1125(+)